jgi:hypothetical protein
MLISDEGSTLNDDYAPRTGLFRYPGVPGAPDGTLIFEFYFSIPLDEFRLIHYDVYGNVILPPEPSVSHAIMPSVNTDKAVDGDDSIIASQPPLDDAFDFKPSAKPRPRDST